MLLFYYTLELAFTGSTIRAILILISIFTYISIHICFGKELFLSLSYAVIYIGALTVIFLGLIILVDHHQLYVKGTSSARLIFKFLLTEILLEQLILMEISTLGMRSPFTPDKL